MKGINEIESLVGAVENLSDETIRGVVEAIIKGVATGAVEELIDRLGVVDVVVDYLAAAGSYTQAADGSGADSGESRSNAGEVHALATGDASAPEPSLQPATGQDSAQFTCELCGRVGCRRFDKTPTGWRCSATARCGDRPARTANPRVLRSAPTPVLTTPKRIAAQGVTARCQDCTRTYTLSGIPLHQAVQTHELRNGHIVDVLEVP